MAWRVGVDIGGTFTDFALLNEATGRVWIHKQLSMPADPALAVLDGIPSLLAKAGMALNDVDAVIHGTTLVTNAIIERKRARAAQYCHSGNSRQACPIRESAFSSRENAQRSPHHMGSR